MAHQQPAAPSDPRDIDIADYDYPLPDERIARFPLPERDASKLLLYRGGELGHTVFRELPEVLPAGALLLFNNTRVIHARLVFHRPTGARVEVFCLEPLAPAEHQQSLSSAGPVEWTCLIGNNKRWKEGILTLDIATPAGPVRLHAERLGPHGDAYAVRFRWEGPATLAFGEVLHYAGLIPLPPYLNRESTAADEDRYQTVYARQEGSVAAPTAGLHFTDAVLEGLRRRGIATAFVTLHVGAGTFRPVKADRLADHDMHEEQFHVARETLLAIREAVRTGRPVIPVGTTSLRTLESLAIPPTSARSGEGPETPQRSRPAGEGLISQWAAYEAGHDDPLATLDAHLAALDARGLDAVRGATRLLIAPGYRFRLASGLITNFHQPRSTLLLLIAALVGDDWRRIYDYALANDFRFLSYGDSSLLM